MKKREPVSHIMTADPYALQLNDGLTQAEILFKKHKVRHLPVVSGDKIVGILSQTDLARISFVDSYDPNNFSVDTTVYSLFSLEQIMVRNPTSISPDTLIKDAAEIFLKAEFHALPVVQDKKLVGILTTTDLIKYLLEQY
ncbi:MAG: CBS domain-containing protein [Bacteroidetes bacterium]|nr:CBS domain-containing protein [Bacteroidota bacterium]